MAQSKSLNLLWLSLGLSHASSGFIPDSHASSGFTCLEVLKSVTPSEVNSTIGETAELNATITSLTNRYDRIYPELNLSGMDPKLSKISGSRTDTRTFPATPKPPLPIQGKSLT
jgi:hypothetical protein